jgi:hypothetical protein
LKYSFTSTAKLLNADSSSGSLRQQLRLGRQAATGDRLHELTEATTTDIHLLPCTGTGISKMKTCVSRSQHMEYITTSGISKMAYFIDHYSH